VIKKDRVEQRNSDHTVQMSTTLSVSAAADDVEDVTLLPLVGVDTVAVSDRCPPSVGRTSSSQPNLTDDCDNRYSVHTQAPATTKVSNDEQCRADIRQLNCH